MSYGSGASLRHKGMATHQIPAIVVSRGYTALGSLRSLARAGITTYVVPFDPLAARSRWYRELPGGPRQWPMPLDSRADALLAALPIDLAVPIAGADDAALWLSDVAEGPLASRFPCSISSRATLEILQDKSRFAAWLAGTRIAHPRTWPIRSRGEIEAVPFDSVDRVFLKPADSQSFSNALGVKGVWAHSRSEMIDSWQRLHDLGFAVVVQEYVAGGADDHYFIDGFRDRSGKVVGLFARRRLRIYPPGFGNSSYCESIAIDDIAAARDSLHDLLDALSYRGIFSAEFKREARTGEFKILEVNSRAWWYVEFAAVCGLDVCTMAYHDALDEPITPPGRTRIGAGCINWVIDAKAVMSAEGRLGASWARIARQWLRARYHVFCGDDPMPGLHTMRNLLAHRVRKWLRRKARE